MKKLERPWIVIVFGAEYVPNDGDQHGACLGCGERWRIALPAPVDIVIQTMKMHERRHHRCREKWEARGKPAMLPPSELR